jgi:hypothetical protein
MNRDLHPANVAEDFRASETSVEGPAPDAGAEDWRLYSLFRPGAIYLHLYKPASGTQPVRLSVAGLSHGARDALTRLGRGQRVPTDICAAAFRVNLLC